MAHYPKSGKGKKWTLLELKAIPITWKGDSLSDSEGLVGEVRVSHDKLVSIRFKYAFKWLGKVVWHQCGTWPVSTMESIRLSRDSARQLIKSGVNPTDHKKADRIEKQAHVEAVIADAARQDAQNLPFSAMYAAWVVDGVARKDGNAEIRRSFEKDVLPVLGPMPVKKVTEHDLRGVLRGMVQRDVNRMSVRVYHDLVQLFTWAEKRQPWRSLMIEGNPADLLEIEKIVSPDYDLSDQRDRVFSADEIRELDSIFRSMEKAYAETPVGSKYDVARPLKKETQLALWICLSTLCRIGELLMSQWRDVDLVAGTWKIPVANVKGPRGKKQAQLVSLSGFALRQFSALHDMTGDTLHCFPARNNDGHICVKTVSKQVGDRQTQFKSRTKALSNRRNDNSLVLSKGENNEWTPHDLRRTGATMMQALRVTNDVIDRCQNHIMAGSRVRRHYLHHDYLEEKREAWSLLGKQLESILNNLETKVDVFRA